MTPTQDLLHRQMAELDQDMAEVEALQQLTNGIPLFGFASSVCFFGSLVMRHVVKAPTPVWVMLMIGGVVLLIVMVRLIIGIETRKRRLQKRQDQRHRERA